MVFDEFKILSEALSNLDPINIGEIEYKPQFMYGSNTDMLIFLNHKKQQGGDLYPLIWIETPMSVDYENEVFANADVNVIIATLTKRDLSNIQRMEITFNSVLLPVAEMALESLESQDGIYHIEDEKTVTKYFNYDTNDENVSSDIWDVIRMQIKLKFNINCKIY